MEAASSSNVSTCPWAAVTAPSPRRAVRDVLGSATDADANRRDNTRASRAVHASRKAPNAAWSAPGGAGADQDQAVQTVRMVECQHVTGECAHAVCDVTEALDTERIGHRHHIRRPLLAGVAVGGTLASVSGAPRHGGGHHALRCMPPSTLMNSPVT